MCDSVLVSPRRRTSALLDPNGLLFFLSAEETLYQWYQSTETGHFFMEKALGKCGTQVIKSLSLFNLATIAGLMNSVELWIPWL
jgi:hypothetical protein